MKISLLKTRVNTSLPFSQRQTMTLTLIWWPWYMKVT